MLALIIYFFQNNITIKQRINKLNSIYPFIFMELFNIKKFFNKEYYNDFQIRNNLSNELDFIKNSIKPKKTEKILDIGCGNGRHLIDFEKKNFLNLTGIDISEDLISEAKINSKNINFICDNFIDYNFKNELFDVAMSIFSGFGYFNDEDNEKYLQKTANILRKNGKFILDINNIIYFIKNYEKNKIYEYKNIKNKNKFSAKDCINYSYNEINGKIYEYKMRLYTIPEIKKNTEKLNLKIEKIYGDYDLSEFNFNSKRAILIFRKK